MITKRIIKTIVLAVALIFGTTGVTYAASKTDPVAALKKQISSLQTQIKTLNAKISKYDSTNKSLTKKNSDLEKKVKSLESEINKQKELEKGIPLPSGTGKLMSIKGVVGGINLFVDGNLVKPVDTNGNLVEPFKYNDQVYVPVSALSNALTNHSKPVTFDQKTSSVYVGKAPIADQTDIATLTPYNTSGHVFKEEHTQIEILDKKINAFNRISSEYRNGYVDDAVLEYILDSNYSAITGQYIIPYKSLNTLNEKTSILFYSVNKKGEETLIQQFETSIGDDPLPIKVDLSGVNILRIKFASKGMFSARSDFYNVILTGIK